MTLEVAQGFARYMLDCAFAFIDDSKRNVSFHAVDAKPTDIYMEDRTFAPACGRSRPSGPKAGYRVTSCGGLGEIELEDPQGMRQLITLSYGALETIDREMRRRGLDTPLGLILEREPFSLEGLEFWRWVVKR